MNFRGITIKAYTIPKLLIIGYLVYNCALSPIGLFIPRLSIVLLAAATASILLAERSKFRAVVFKEFGLLLLFAIYASVSGVLIAKDRSLVLSQVLFWAELLVVIYLICIVSYRTGELDIIPWAFLIGSMIIMVYMMLGKATVLKGGRLTLTEGYNSNTLGVFLMLGGWSLLKLCGRMKHNSWSVLFSIVGIVALFYWIIQTGSRKATIGLVVVFMIWLLFGFRAKMSQVRRSVKWMSLLIMIGALAVIAARYGGKILTASDTILRRMEDLENTEGSWIIRLDLVADALKVFIRNPFFGVGLNNYRVYSAYAMYSHNTYAEVLACTGLFGGILFFGLLIYIMIPIFSKTRYDIKNKKDKLNDTYYITLIIVFLLICLTQICIYNRNLMLVFTQIMIVSIQIRSGNVPNEEV